MQQPKIIQIAVVSFVDSKSGEERSSIIGLSDDSKVYRWQKDGGAWELNVYQPAAAGANQGRWY